MGGACEALRSQGAGLIMNGGDSSIEGRGSFHTGAAANL